MLASNSQSRFLCLASFVISLWLKPRQTCMMKGLGLFMAYLFGGVYAGYS